MLDWKKAVEFLLKRAVHSLVKTFLVNVTLSVCIVYFLHHCYCYVYERRFRVVALYTTPAVIAGLETIHCPVYN